MNSLQIIRDLCTIWDDPRSTEKERDAALTLIRFYAKSPTPTLFGADLSPRVPAPASLAEPLIKACVAPMPIEIPKAAPIEFPEPLSDQNPEPVGFESGTTLADQILEILPQLIVEFPKGPTAGVIAARIDATEYDTRLAMKKLDQSQRAQYVRRLDSAARHLMPIGYEPPEPQLTPAQQSVFNAISAAVVDGVAKISHRQISGDSGINMGNVASILINLEKKNRIKQIERAPATQSSTFKILTDAPISPSNQDGADS